MEGNTMTKLKFALLGCGRISARHVEALVKNKDEAELVGVYDTVKELAEDRKKQYESLVEGSNVKVYSDYDQLLNSEDIDVVTIATISGYHAQQAIDCLNHNKHVIIEKPMALSIVDANRIIALGKKKNKKVCVSHQNRYNPAVQKLRQAIDEGRFGKLIHGTARTLWARDDNYYKEASWRGTKALDGGTLMNQCIHNIDLLQWLLGGEVERIYAESDTFIRDIETEDFGAILIRFKNGAVGIVEGSVCIYPRNLEESLSIFGEKGTVVIKNGVIETWRFADEKEYDHVELANNSLGHTPLYKDVIAAIKEGREPLVNGEEGKKAVEIILKAIEGKIYEGNR
jgi:UDP-N-acetyl-2-amino-2-deoxyglucuronate dehydrogenase